MEMNEKLKNIFYKSAIVATILSGAVIGIDRYYDIMGKPKSEMPIDIIKYITTVEKHDYLENTVHEENHMKLHEVRAQEVYDLSEKLDEAKKETVEILKTELDKMTDLYKVGAVADEIETLHNSIETVKNESLKNLEELAKEQERKRIETEEKIKIENEKRLKEIEIKQKTELERKTAEYNLKLSQEKKVLEERLNLERKQDKINYEARLEETKRANQEKQQKLESLEQQVLSLKRNQSTQSVPQYTPQQNFNTNLQRSPTMRSQQTYQTPSSSHTLSRGSYSDPETRARVEAHLESVRQEEYRKREQYRMES